MPAKWTWVIIPGFHVEPSELDLGENRQLSGALKVYSLCEVPGVGLFAGTNPAGNVYLSPDYGDTWTNTAELAGAVHVFDLLPASDGRIYAATKGEVGTTDGHVFYTANLGGSWIPTADLGVDVESVFCLLELSGGGLLAGSGPNGDVYRSDDGGLSWTPMGDLGGAESVNVLLEASDGMLYAGTSPNGDVFRSADGGYTWVDTADITLSGRCLCSHRGRNWRNPRWHVNRRVYLSNNRPGRFMGTARLSGWRSVQY